MDRNKELDEAVRRVLKQSKIGQPNPDRFKNLLAAFIIGSFVGILPLFIFWGIPTTSKDIVTYIVGQLSGMATTILGAYFVNNIGKDKQDAKNAETTGKLAEAVASAQSSNVSAVQGAEAVANAANNKADEIKGE